MIALRETTGGVSFSVRVQPSASRTTITGVLEDALKVAVAAPPVEGKANEVLIRFFAGLFEVPRSTVEIISGGSSRKKTIRVRGIEAEFVRKRIITCQDSKPS